MEAVVTDEGERMEKNRWGIVHIPGKPPIPPDQQPTVDVVVSVVEPKFASTLIGKLNRIAPLENLHHVKRVQKKHLEGGKIQLLMILCVARENDDRLENIPHTVLELVNSHQLSTFITKVCRYAASNREQWEEQCKIWPTTYHPPTFNIDGITGFNEENSQSVFSFMKFALELSKSNGQLVNAAVIVDPSVKQVIASARDEVWSRHANTDKADTCVNGASNPETALLSGSVHEPKCVHMGISCLNPWQWTEPTSSCYWHPLRHAAIVAIENSAARDRRLFAGLEHREDCVEKRQKINLTEVGDPCKRPYLCTGYDIYLVWEPCTMCAMALIHQRIRRVFYAFENPNEGAVGSVERLQGESGLNHHYAVFRVSMPALPASLDCVYGNLPFI